MSDQTDPDGAAGRPVNDAAEGRKRQAIALFFLLVGAVLLWVSSRLVWSQVFAADGQGAPHTYDVHGSDWSPWLVAVAGALAAAGVAQFAFRGIARRVVAVIVALGAVAVSIPAISLITAGENNLYAAGTVDIPSNYQIISVSAKTFPGYVVIFAAVWVLIGAIMMLRSASAASTGMSSKYTSPAARREELERKAFAERERRLAAGDDAADADTSPGGTERELWEALDHGVDPTDDPDTRS
ncbi:MAG: TIGR02234 family membrane protein [Gordonia sp. (in: high G+C Gram-positive bacteria)]|uniref:TIGR02234 family membrane protein n=1 Tax=Gordonia sp. (in: high G+C Gram-positive bacteria) TaxID=84139 RepID=UPI0039E5E6E8